MKLKCTASIGGMYWKSNEKSAEGMKQKRGAATMDGLAGDDPGTGKDWMGWGFHVGRRVVHPENSSKEATAEGRESSKVQNINLGRRTSMPNERASEKLTEVLSQKVWRESLYHIVRKSFRPLGHVGCSEVGKQKDLACLCAVIWGREGRERMEEGLSQSNSASDLSSLPSLFALLPFPKCRLSSGM